MRRARAHPARGRRAGGARRGRARAARSRSWWSASATCSCPRRAGRAEGARRRPSAASAARSAARTPLVGARRRPASSFSAARLRRVLAPAARRRLAVRAPDRAATASAAATAGSTRSAAAPAARGAADPAGPFGTGRRLRAGQRVLWFWCVKDAARRVPAHAGDVAAPRPVAPGAPLARHRARLRRGGHAACRSPARPSARRRRRAVTGADGVATRHRARRAGRYALEASKRRARARVPADGAGRLMRRAAPARCSSSLAAARGRLRPGRGREQGRAARRCSSRATSAPREVGDGVGRPDPRRRDRDADAPARLRRRDALRRRLRAVDRRRRRRRARTAGRSTGSTTSTGSCAEDGAAAHDVGAGRPRSGGTATTGARRSDIPAVVGAFPEPFRSGADGKRLPVRLECADDAEAACDEVAERLGDVGVNAAALRRGAASAASGRAARRGRPVGRRCARDAAVAPARARARRRRGVFARPDGGRRARSSCSTRSGEVERDARARAPGWSPRRAGRRARRPGSSPAPTTPALAAAAARSQEERAARPLRARGRATAGRSPLPLLPPPETP